MEEQLISAVFAKEALWNPKNSGHKHVNLLQKLWLEVADEIGYDVKTIKNKWKYLRDYFKRETKKTGKPKSGAGFEDMPQESTWQYYNMMLFLKDLLVTDQQESSLKENSVVAAGTQDIFCDNSKDSEQSLQEPFSPPGIFHPESESTSNTFSKKNNFRDKETRKRFKCDKNDSDEILIIEKKKLDLLERDMAKEEDDDLLFFKSLLPDVKSLPRWRKRRLRLKVQELVIKEMEEAEGDVIISCIPQENPQTAELYIAPTNTTSTFCK